MLFAFPILILFIYLIINPRLSPVLLSYKRSKMIKSFIESTKKQNKINPKEFWALREFYYPGTLKVNKYLYPQPFLVFNSNKITSTEALVDTTNSKPLVFPNIQGKKLIHKSLFELIFYDNPSKLRIIFYKPISEMITANAVYDYKDKDKKLLENKLWYVNTLINLQ